MDEFGDKFISMKKENSKLYFENFYFMEQNEKLRKTAEFLEKQNHVLLNGLKQRVAATTSVSCVTNTTSESFSREADQSSTTSASEASTSTRTKAPKSRKKSKK